MIELADRAVAIVDPACLLERSMTWMRTIGGFRTPVEYSNNND